LLSALNKFNKIGYKIVDEKKKKQSNNLSQIKSVFLRRLAFQFTLLHFSYVRLFFKDKNSMKSSLSPVNEFKTRLCYTLVSDIMERVERELVEVKAIQFLNNYSWTYGKRLRPIVFLLSNLSMRTATTRSLETSARESQFASAIELLHEASLIHDDIVDKSNLRRGKPTLQVTHGDGLSLLIGDYLIFQGLKLILDAAESQEDIYLAKELANAGLSIAHGEAEQLDRYLNQDSIDIRMSMENYLGIIAKKTAAFFSGCSEAGAALGGADIEVRKNFREFGMNLGLLFQMMDDMMDILGDESIAKKSLKNNINEGTITLPIIHAWILYPNHHELEKLAKKQEIDALDAEVIYNMLSEKNVIVACKNTLQEYVDKITKSLTIMPKNIYSMGLADIFDYVKHCPWAGIKW
jgi:geranylgeranyl pyrophosphate synthase